MEALLLSVLNVLAALALAPLLVGVVNRTKAVFAGRQGQPLTQLYRDVWKLLQKGAVYSRTTTWVVRAGPVVGLASVLAALALVPMAGQRAVLGFAGDLVLLAYLLGLGRFFTVAAALDTGSSFEGMGASREVYFAALVEPSLLLSLLIVCRTTGTLSLSEAFRGLGAGQPGLTLGVVALVLFVVFLTENSRIPVDDPNTHLELTMIHEVMVLDHGGPDLGFILYGSALKMWVLGALVVGTLLPRGGAWWVDVAGFLAGMAGVGIVTGVVESTMARLRLVHVPDLLLGAGAVAALAALLAG
jgi:formate hydrogenlyase subunit 4